MSRGFSLHNIYITLHKTDNKSNQSTQSTFNIGTVDRRCLNLSTKGD